MELVTRAAFHLYVTNVSMGLANCVIMRYLRNTTPFFFFFLKMLDDVNGFIWGV